MKLFWCQREYSCSKTSYYGSTNVCLNACARLGGYGDCGVGNPHCTYTTTCKESYAPSLTCSQGTLSGGRCCTTTYTQKCTCTYKTCNRGYLSGNGCYIDGKSCSCPSNTTHSGSYCYLYDKSSCPSGYSPSSTNYTYTCKHCPSGYYEKNNACYYDRDSLENPSCPSDFQLNQNQNKCNSKNKKISCGAGETKTSEESRYSCDGSYQQLLAIGNSSWDNLYCTIN